MICLEDFKNFIYEIKDYQYQNNGYHRIAGLAEIEAKALFLYPLHFELQRSYIPSSTIKAELFKEKAYNFYTALCFDALLRASP